MFNAALWIPLAFVALCGACGALANPQSRFDKHIRDWALVGVGAFAVLGLTNLGSVHYPGPWFSGTLYDIMYARLFSEGPLDRGMYAVLGTGAVDSVVGALSFGLATLLLQSREPAAAPQPWRGGSE